MDDDAAGMTERALIVGGVGCVAAAVVLLILGSASTAILTFVFLGVGTALLLVGLVRMRMRDPVASRPSPGSSGSAQRIVWIGAAVLGAVAIAASIVAATVAVGEATGHAVGHLVVGLACLGLFIVVAAMWRPAYGSTRASIRGMVLLVLGVGALGSFVESLGGAGYDAANLERRISSLASLHGVGVIFGPVAILAIPIGLVTLLTVGLTAVARRARQA